MRVWSVIVIILVAINISAASTNSFIQKNIKIVNDETQLVTLKFQNIKTRAALQLLAELSNLNIIVSDKVQTTLTLYLANISWQEALNIILQSQGLEKLQHSNVLLIVPYEEFGIFEKQKLQTQQQIEDLQPLNSELISIKYAKATSIANLLKNQGNSLLSKRANVSVDARTNTIWIQEIAAKLIDVRKIIQKLDVPVKQILIEARIVNIDADFEAELGVRFGITSANQLSGSLEGTNALLNGKVGNAIPISDRLNIDLPATGVSKVGGAASVGIALARLAKNTLLDLELSAMESEGSGQIISRPKLITTDQQPAVIEAGEEIPYQQETSGGSTNIAFKKAVLSLNVTPQITPEGKVMLQLKVNQDKTGARQVLGVPSIDTREIKTQVLVNDGETIVLGGIYEESQNKQVQRVPFLGTLPLIGNLFQHKKTSNSRKELLIFVTPYVLATPTTMANKEET